MYENMKTRVNDVVERGYISDDYKSSSKAFSKWDQHFTIHDHPAVVHVTNSSTIISPF